MVFIQRQTKHSFLRNKITSDLVFAAMLLSSACVFVSCVSKNKNDVTGKQNATLVVLPAPTPVPASEKSRLYNESKTWFDTILKNTGFNGGMLVAKGGTIVFEEYKGTVRPGGKESIDAHTPFHVASVSKTITAMATLKLWQDGKLNIDDDYSKYFPGFNYPGVTIRNLLSHRSGLPNYLYFMEKMWPDKKVHIRNQDIFDYLVTRKGEMENVSPPNTRFTYCNTNYALLALLIEKVTGLPFPRYIHDTFFVPLAMDNSFIYTPADSAAITPNYDWRGREIPLNFLDDVYGDKNMYTTVRDLLKWDRALASNTIFTAHTLEEAYKPYSNEKQGIKNYGLGWHLNIFPNGKKMIFHNGWWHGNNAAFLRLPDEDATIIVVNNRFTSAVYKAKMLINSFAHYYDAPVEEDVDNIQTVIPSKKIFLSKKKQPSTGNR